MSYSQQLREVEYSRLVAWRDYHQWAYEHFLLRCEADKVDLEKSLHHQQQYKILEEELERRRQTLAELSFGEGVRG